MIGNETGQSEYRYGGRLYAKKSDFKNGFANPSEYIRPNREDNINTYTEHSHEIKSNPNPLDEYIQIHEVFSGGKTQPMIPSQFIVIESSEKRDKIYTKLVLRPGKLVLHEGLMVYVINFLFNDFDRMLHLHEKAESRGSTGIGTRTFSVRSGPQPQPQGTRSAGVVSSQGRRSRGSSQERDGSPPPDAPRHDQSFGEAFSGFSGLASRMARKFGFGSGGGD